MSKMLLICWLLMNNTGRPLPFMNVQMKGGSTGAQTDAAGNFSLTVPNGRTAEFAQNGGYQ